MTFTFWLQSSFMHLTPFHWIYMCQKYSQNLPHPWQSYGTASIDLRGTHSLCVTQLYRGVHLGQEFFKMPTHPWKSEKLGPAVSVLTFELFNWPIWFMHCFTLTSKTKRLRKSLLNLHVYHKELEFLLVHLILKTWLKFIKHNATLLNI